MKHILSVLVENRTGVLHRVAGLFSRRAYNIDSLVVGITQDPTVSRMTIVIDSSENNIEQVTKQLHKLIDVIKITDITENALSRQFAFIKIRCKPETRSEILLLSNVFDAKIVDINSEIITLEIVGDDEMLSNIRMSLGKYTIVEMVQTGIVSIERGASSLNI